MAYARRSYRRTTTRRKRAGSSRRSYRRKTYTRKRTYSRRTRAPRMSVRSLLNRTSQKKRDTMMTWTNVREDATPGNNDYTPGPARLNGDPGTWYTFVFCPTARGVEDRDGVVGSKAQTAMRTSTTVYAKGYRENINLSTISGRGWTWRRITFTMKGDSLNLGNNDPNTSDVFRETSNGYMRLLAYSSATFRAQDIIFKGTQNVDWQDVMQAPIDTRRISLKSDRTYRISSGNADGVQRFIKRWYPMEKNIYYEDDETGDKMSSSPFAVENGHGMGDYYIVDFFRSNPGSTPTDVLRVDFNGTYFWHEK
uniref:Capsid protein n=1 Tax=Finch associated genomovirus 2 TaxID=2576454 RepID=A0A4P8PL39_9VIRU|nr:capsid protein [Finch associated genomovirus 2]